jgi:hypothetical protein
MSWSRSTSSWPSGAPSGGVLLGYPTRGRASSSDKVAVCLTRGVHPAGVIASYSHLGFYAVATDFLGNGSRCDLSVELDPIRFTCRPTGAVWDRYGPRSDASGLSFAGWSDRSPRSSHTDFLGRQRYARSFRELATGRRRCLVVARRNREAVNHDDCMRPRRSCSPALFPETSAPRSTELFNISR